MHAGLGSVNTLESAYMCRERPVMWGALKKIQNKLGKKNFPLVDQTYYPHFRQMVIAPECPCVVKLGFAHSGFGKVCVHDYTILHRQY